MGYAASSQSKSERPDLPAYPLLIKPDPTVSVLPAQSDPARGQEDMDRLRNDFNELDIGRRGTQSMPREVSEPTRVGPGDEEGSNRRDPEPTSLDANCDRTLACIGEAFAAQVHHALEWVAFSVRPIRLEELSEVMLHSRDPPGVGRSSDDESFVALKASGLIFVSDDTREVKLSNASIKDYLASDRIRTSRSAFYATRPIEANARITSTCLNYLLKFSGPEKISVGEKEKFPLLEYAARYWHVHARRVAQDPAEASIWEQLRPLVLRLFDPNIGESFRNWLRASRPDVGSSSSVDGGQDLSSMFFSDKSDEFGSPLYYASACGLVDIVSSFIAQGQSARTRAESVSGALYPGPLEVAVERGFVDVVTVLLEAGANPNTWIESAGTCLNRAALRGHKDILRILLDHGASVNAQMDDGSTALHCAASKGSISAADLLLEHGVQVNAKTYIGTTPLHEAVIELNEEMAKFLLERGANVDATTDKSLRTDRGGGLLNLITIMKEQNREASREVIDAINKTALYIAADSNSLSLVRLLLSHGASINAPTNLGATALYVATCRGHTDVVKLLLASGANANIRTASGATMLHAAAESKKPELVEIFIKRGIDPNALNDWNDTALIRAVSKGCLPVVQKFAELGGNLHKSKESTEMPLLQFACLYGYYDIAAYLLSQAVDVNAKNGQGGTALIQACSHGHVDILKLLLEQGADINAAMSVRNLSPLHVAVMGEQKDIMKQLLIWSTPANTDAQDEDGNTPLHYTVSQPNKELSELLLQHGANPNAPNEHSVTPLEIAVREERDLVSLLIEYGADPAAAHPSGSTVLGIAVYRDDSELVEQLMRKQKSIEPLLDALYESGINGRAIKFEDTEMLTWAIVKGKEVVAWMFLHYGGISANVALPPLTYPVLVVAAQYGHQGLVKLLIRMGADVNGHDEKGLKAIHVATAIGNAEIVRTLLEGGCDIHDLGDGRGTPLWFALSNRHDAVVRLLCQYGADLATEEKKMNITVMIGPKQIFYGIRQ